VKSVFLFIFLGEAFHVTSTQEGFTEW